MLRGPTSFPKSLIGPLDVMPQPPARTVAGWWPGHLPPWPPPVPVIPDAPLEEDLDVPCPGDAAVPGPNALPHPPPAVPWRCTLQNTYTVLGYSGAVVAEAAAVTVAAVLAGCGVVLVLCLVAAVAVAAPVAATGAAAVTVNLAGYGCAEPGRGVPVVGWALGSGLGQGVVFVG